MKKPIYVSFLICFVLGLQILLAQNVGIGNANPKAKLDIYGNIKIGTDSADAQKGTIRFLSNEFEGWNGSAWIPMRSRWSKGSGTKIYYPLGNVGINQSDPNAWLHVSSTSSAQTAIIAQRDNAGNFFQGQDQTGTDQFTLVYGNNGYSNFTGLTANLATWPNQMTLVRDGKIGFGTRTPASITGITSAKVEFASDDPNNSDWTLRLASSTASAWPAILFAKSAGTLGSIANVSVNHRLGGLEYYGYFGSRFYSSAYMRVQVDATPGASDMPSSILFGTAQDGSSSPSERMRITNRGFVGINTSTPGTELDVKGTVRLSGSSSGFVGHNATANAGSTTYTWPTSAPSANEGYVLTSNTTGTLAWTNKNSHQDFMLARTNVTMTNGANNLTNLEGWSFIKISGPTSNFYIRSMSDGVDGKIIIVYNATDKNMTLKNDDSGVPATDRILTLHGNDLTINGSGAVFLAYDGDEMKWIVVSHYD